MENDNAPPKLDLTRIDDFDALKEPEGPDMGTLLGLQPAPDPATNAAAGASTGAGAGLSETDALLAAIREPQAESLAPIAPPPITSVSIPPPFRGGGTKLNE